MSLLTNFAIIGSAMRAQAVRMNVTASNLANADSVNGDPQATYRARQPVFAAMLSDLMTEDSQQGVTVSGIVEKGGTLEQKYEPGNPLANAQGYVYLPNVNIVEEMTNMISASRSYQTDVEVLNSTKQMISALLRLGE